MSCRIQLYYVELLKFAIAKRNFILGEVLVLPCNVCYATNLDRNLAKNKRCKSFGLVHWWYKTKRGLKYHFPHQCRVRFLRHRIFCPSVIWLIGCTIEPIENKVELNIIYFCPKMQCFSYSDNNNLHFECVCIGEVDGT